MDKFLVLPITKISDIAPNVKTFYFSHRLQGKPGQFLMLWLPGIGQKPFAISHQNATEFGVTVFKRGAFTRELFINPPGTLLGIAGPYGTAFSIKPRNHYIFVAGGYGAAPLRFLVAELMMHSRVSIDFCLGAENKESLLFATELKKFKRLQLHLATTDGSEGYQGLVTDYLPQLIQSIKSTKLVVTCGPELMMQKVLAICNQYQVEFEVSLERYIKCGVGVCGHCSVDGPGICVCKEGPVVSGKIANQITEFGKYERDKTGKKHYFQRKVYA